MRIDVNINDKIEVVYNNKLHICEITSLEPFNIKVIEKGKPLFIRKNMEEELEYLRS